MNRPKEHTMAGLAAEPVEIRRRPLVEVTTASGQRFLAIPHIPSMDRVRLHVLLLGLTINPGCWHELKTYRDEDRAVRFGQLLDAQAPDIETLVVDSTLYARVVAP